ncbi:MAG: hypothetical protein AAFV88_17950 [Planctomycetota bacterium]
MTKRLLFAFLLLPCALMVQVGCGGSSEATVIEQPTEDFLEEIRQGQQQYSSEMKDEKKSRRR